MLKDIVPQISETVQKNPTFLFDNYSLKEGLYIKLPFRKDFSKETVETMLIDKKTDETKLDAQLLHFFKERDILSSVLNDDMNKSLDIPKKSVHNVNVFTLFAKKEYLYGKENDQDLSAVQEHYFKFFNEKILHVDERLLDLYPMRARKKKDKLLEAERREAFFKERFNELISYIQSEKRQQNLEMIQQFWRTQFEQVMEYVRLLVQENNVKNYVKLYFDVDLSLYEKEYDIYVLPRIFNVNTYNELLEDEIVGLPAYDISMNSKKPFYEMKTRKDVVPTRVSLEEALMMTNLRQWLLKKGKFKEIKLSFEQPFGPGTEKKEKKKNIANGAYYLALDKNGSIDDYDNVPFDAKESWVLLVENVLERQEKMGDQYFTKAYEPIEKKSGLRAVINQLFFNNYMPRNLLDREAPKPKENVFTSEMVSIYMMTRQALFDYLVKDTPKTIEPFIKKYSLDLIENQLLQTTKGHRFHKIADAYQVRLALLKEINEVEGIKLADEIKDIYTTLKTKLKTKKDMVACESDTEFFFLAGQMGSYLLSQSVADKENKNYGLAEPIIKSRNAHILKNKLTDLFDTYKHAVWMNHTSFNNGMAMLQGYQTDAKIADHNRSMLIAGLCANNLFYQKNDEEEK
ncbi:hypothetical protein MUB24_08500 [Lederbergia sp. NSJ-179]|uniref:hypothetical protein n=1 Tax=Lederbergia sp. NSJ-179 TaxID=2931402 RepID=UPI001FD5AB19|nr:hypothetical protein [Lederbergia sp. NSJ-179]MCJ7840941.1 hypothetical protein [Lederbergia sp. NSJ-179]